MRPHASPWRRASRRAGHRRRGRRPATLELGLAGLMDRAQPHRAAADQPDRRRAATPRASTELHSGGYYLLDIISDGTQEHAIEAPGLFRNVWINEVVINDLEVRPLGLNSIEFDDEGTVSLSFVAITPGSVRAPDPRHHRRDPARRLHHPVTDRRSPIQGVSHAFGKAQGARRRVAGRARRASSWRCSA